MKKLLFLLALLSGIFPGIALTANAGSTYTCDDNSKLLVTYLTNNEGRPLAALSVAGKSLNLALIPSGSGTHYRGDGANFYTRGDDAILEDGTAQIRRCRLGDKPPAITPQPAPTAAVSSFVDITGSVAYRQRIALPPDAILTVRVQDTSRADSKARTLAEQTIELAGQQVPINFQLTVDRDLMGKKARITLAALIVSRGKLLFISDKVYPVNIEAGKSHVDMQLRQISAPRKP